MSFGINMYNCLVPLVLDVNNKYWNNRPTELRNCKNKVQWWKKTVPTKYLLALIQVPRDHCSSPPPLFLLTFTYIMPVSLPNIFFRNFNLSFFSLIILSYSLMFMSFLSNFCQTTCSYMKRSLLFFPALAHCSDFTVCIRIHFNGRKLLSGFN